MPATISRFQEGPERKRKAHAKSRKGCGNCKLRRVKCDETRPRCQKCLSYGVSCNYNGKESSLELSAQGSFQVDLSPRSSLSNRVVDMGLSPPLSINQNMVAMANDCLNTGSLDMDIKSMDGFRHWHQANFWTFTEQDLGVMKRFQERTVMTIGTKKTAPAYRDCIYQLSFRHPFLMHMVLSLTLMHDAHLATHSPSLAASTTRASLQHWNTATKLFNRILSNTILPSARDAIWATGALIGATVFAYVESSDPFTAWPLKPSDPHDLDWLKLSEGKKAIWKLADPLRPDSIFHNISKEHSFVEIPQWIRANNLSTIPEDVLAIFDITPESTVTNNVYHLPTLILSRLHSLAPTHDNALNFLYFMGYMTADFRGLLETKDPRALLLLAWWFKKLEKGELWWLTRRAKVEGEGIRIWLERWHGVGALNDLFDRLEMPRGNEEGLGRGRKLVVQEDSPALPGPWCGAPAAYEGLNCPVQ
ncbi:hypothetical protein K505DRAFT_237379 [Melanomma pulvis-pyrius CBS 109.77]|uniref:Zn(2)-C6 fungal-type domain-containing protein n=1 Tax=Melanomma pulvis-pyrius CBS 109.77 TaxID=1314802 RepID=A0A6A6XL09_9PLEO|nr:hypothetical protein K505DRAFT_237379 [Melanomma pulvis-pyrius CBS 109.77]